MNNYYFTFGQDHHTIDDYPMKDHWVRVVAADYVRAREIFVMQFSSLQMPRQDKWAFQYEEKDFNKEFFPKGEYQMIADIRAEQTKENQWWGYQHINGKLQAKVYYDWKDITLAEISPFVAQVVYPFLARDREHALAFIQQQVKNH